MRRALTATAEDDPRELTDACERSQLHVDGELDKYFEKTRCKSTLHFQPLHRWGTRSR